MASKTLTVGTVFPDGSTVAAYPVSNWRQGLALSGAPVGSTAGSAGAISGGAVTVTGLTDDTQYALAGDIGGGTYRYLRFDTARSTAPATQTDLAGKAPLLSIVTSLPSSPVDGQECFYLADATNGVLWHLKYRAAEAGSYKWYVVSGASLFAETAADETTASASYTDLSGGATGPSVTLPLAGDYDVQIGAETYNGTLGASCYMSYAIGGTAAADADLFRGRQSDVASGFNIAAQGTRPRRKTALAAVALTAKYKVSAGTGHYVNRWIRATPVRVG